MPTLIAYANTSGLAEAQDYHYFGGVYDSVHNRIYLVPSYQSDKDYWHYIDIATNTVVAYENPAPDRASLYGYWGGVFDYVHHRVYFIPWFQSNQPKWHYVDTDTNTVVAYANAPGHVATVYGYNSGLFDSQTGKVWLHPDNQSNRPHYHAIDTNTNAVFEYGNACVSDIVSNGYDAWGEPVAFDPVTRRMYLVPYWQAMQSYWHYIDLDTATVVAYENPAANRPSSQYAYGQAIVDSSSRRVYFVPGNDQSNEQKWHYVNIDTNTLVAYENVCYNEIEQYGYYGSGTFDPIKRRIYLKPDYNYNQTRWHYIDTVASNVCGYDVNPSEIGDWYPYDGITVDPTNGDAVFALSQQGIKDKLHYFDADTDTLATYDNVTENRPITTNRTVGAYYSGVYVEFNSNKRIYLLPAYQSSEPFWHYVSLGLLDGGGGGSGGGGANPLFYKSGGGEFSNTRIPDEPRKPRPPMPVSPAASGRRPTNLAPTSPAAQRRDTSMPQAQTGAERRATSLPASPDSQSARRPASTSVRTPTGNALYAMIEYRDVSADRVRTGKLAVVHANASVTQNAFEFGQPTAVSTIVSTQAAVALTGAGLCPCGVSPIGVGLLASSAAATVARVAPRAVLINRSTRDIVLDDAGNEMEMSPTDQRVFILLNTVYGSRKSDPTMGFRRPLRMSASIETETRDHIKQALMPLIEDHSIELLSVTTFYG